MAESSFAVRSSKVVSAESARLHAARKFSRHTESLTFPKLSRYFSPEPVSKIHEMRTERVSFNGKESLNPAWA